ncbi:hypothetical protein GCM10020367_63130 [Streptomyces sannanensis]|uniref:ATP-grasp domain-containing protein n=1 Tax=Streptomyces sannanensis TaxID=285536 RepID=A0ABP6SKU2_9ACTN
MAPKLAVVLDFGSVTPMDIILEADSSIDLVWVCDTSLPYIIDSMPLLREVGTVVERNESVSVEQTAETLRTLGVDGIITFSDSQIGTAASIAALLRLRYHAGQAPAVLTDKYLQRAGMSAGGVDSLQFAKISTIEDVASASSLVGLPAVLKPTHGSASRNAYLVEDEAALLRAAERSWMEGEQVLILEEWLRGDPAIAGKAWGDYVSVESLVVDGTIKHLGVTGKPPLAEPFRETGAFFPSTLSTEAQVGVLELVTKALRSLSVEHGVCHTEVKLTPTGPRIIEVNGRLGGYVNDIYFRSAGVRLLRIAMLAALGQVDEVEAELKPWPSCQVAYQFCVAPPTWAHRVGWIGGVSQTNGFPGVQRVEVRRPAGATVDWRDGTGSAVAVVHGLTQDHDLLHLTKSFIDDSLVAEYVGLNFPS